MCVIFQLCSRMEFPPLLEAVYHSNYLEPITARGLPCSRATNWPLTRRTETRPRFWWSHFLWCSFHQEYPVAAKMAASIPQWLAFLARSPHRMLVKTETQDGTPFRNSPPDVAQIAMGAQKKNRKVHIYSGFWSLFLWGFFLCFFFYLFNIVLQCKKQTNNNNKNVWIINCC